MNLRSPASERFLVTHISSDHSETRTVISTRHNTQKPTQYSSVRPTPHRAVLLVFWSGWRSAVVDLPWTFHMDIFFPPTPQWPAWPKLPLYSPPSQSHSKSRSVRTGIWIHRLSVEAFSSLKNEGQSRAKRHHLTYPVFTI